MKKILEQIKNHLIASFVEPFKVILEYWWFFLGLIVLSLIVFMTINKINDVGTYYKKMETKIFNDNKKYFSGKYELRKISLNKSSETEVDSDFFLFIGSEKYKRSEICKIRLCFKNFRNEYEFKDFDIKKVSIKINNNVETPFIVFRYNPKDYYLSQYDSYSERSVIIDNIIINCKESDFKQNINLNLIK